MFVSIPPLASRPYYSRILVTVSYARHVAIEKEVENLLGKKNSHRALSPLHSRVLQFKLCDTKGELREVAAGDTSQAAEQDTCQVSIQEQIFKKICVG
jgi:hypothetical protein